MEALNLGEPNLQNLSGGENREVDTRPPKQPTASKSPIPNTPTQGVSQNTLPIAIPSKDNRTPIQNVIQPASPMLIAPRRPLGDNWQAKGATVRERNACLYNNVLMSNVKFLVGPKNGQQRVPAHKYILASGSSVFFAMFYGDLAENQTEIVIPDVEPQAFLTLLKYLYCDEVDLTPDNVLTTLYAAKKYYVPHLAQACVCFLERSLSAKNACVLLSQSHLFEEPDLMQRCWEVIDAQAEVALASDSFLEVDYKTLESILMRETLNIKEIVLFRAVSRWADAECSRKGLYPNPENKRKVLGKALYLVRIPTMPVEEYANEAAQCGLLTLQETTDVFLHFMAANKPKLQFACHPRKGLRTCKVHRFQSSAYRSNQWRYRGRCDSIKFSVDKRVFIAGYGLYGSSSGAADYGIKMELKQSESGKVLGEAQTNFFSDGSSNTFPVMFPNPVQVEPRVYYTASVILCGSELSYFGQEGLTEVTDHHVTFKFECSPESTNGTGVQGGQIPELIFYA
ncbi:BTB/POZ domain-containing protein 6-like [Acanthaster planci]|uniref:BTB/POZ domain-containing protein 6-like n=1 Tax=Acanthaster planci TaxID=133434 RepID=A0A8B7Y390_ACAPL|nr:BTB/POZ domain-containing protein 6-like [Acanthaster planci]